MASLKSAIRATYSGQRVRNYSSNLESTVDVTVCFVPVCRYLYEPHQLALMAPFSSLTCFCFCLFIYSSALSQHRLTKVLDATGSGGVWINDLTVVGHDVFVIDGLMTGELVVRQDTLYKNNKDTKRFLALFREGAVKSTSQYHGKVGGFYHQSYFISQESSDAHIISKLDLNHNLIWESPLPLNNSLPARIIARSLCFDGDGNTFVLLTFPNSNGQVQLGNEVMSGPGDVVIKLDKNGALVSKKKISGISYTFAQLRMVENRVLAYGGFSFRYNSYLLDADLKTEIRDDKLSTRGMFSIEDEINYYRIKEEGSRPKRLFYVEKHNVKSEIASRKKVFQDTLRFQDEIYQYDLLNLNRKKLACVYVARGKKINDSYPTTTINVLIIKKKNLDITRQIEIDCKRLKTGEPGISSSIIFRIYRRELLIGNEYVSNCRIGNIEFGGKSTSTKYPSFFIVSLALE